MSHAPFDGLILDDPRPPVPGATAMLLHLRVEQERATRGGQAPLGLEALKLRAQACQDLMAHGLWPSVLRELARHGLDLGRPERPHDLASLLAHFDAYLAAVDAAGHLETDRALWEAVDREMEGKRALWVERTEEDGPLEAGLRALLPTRLRFLACLKRIGPVRFRLATQKGDGTSGLFGSSQPLAEWFLEGLESHGYHFPNDLELAEPLGWGQAPWSRALEGLFEGPMALEPYREVFQRGLVDGPFDLLRHAVEQVLVWVDEGVMPDEITLIHPEPQAVASILEALLAAEGVALHVRGGLRPLLTSVAWSPLWALLQGLMHEDPVRFAAGLGASSALELRAWANVLGQADQNGEASFTDTLSLLDEETRSRAAAFWARLEPWRRDRAPALQWAERLKELRSGLDLKGDPEAFFAPHALLVEAWDHSPWDLREFLTALRLFLESARDAEIPREIGGVCLLSPGTLLDEWPGSRATLVLDLSEGAWPARLSPNPDLDWDRKLAINQALLAASRAEDTGSPFPRALQRFWLPRSEVGDTIPRAFQRDAYAFNTLLALTRERVVVLSPDQDEEGRPLAQGPFWAALEGAAPWQPARERASSRLRMAWGGHVRQELADTRAAAVVARPLAEALTAHAPEADRVPDVLSAWRDQEGHVSPSGLEDLAACPFRALAKRVWRLEPEDAASRLNLHCGTLVHLILEALQKPYIEHPRWTAAFMRDHALNPEPEAEDLHPIIRSTWEANREDWLKGLKNLPDMLREALCLHVEELLPNLAAALVQDLASDGPTRQEVALLHPELVVPARGNFPLQHGWSRTLLGTETALGPLSLDLGDGLHVSLKGKADRVERFEHEDAGPFIRITDWKTSRKTRLEAFAKGEAPFSTHLQTPVYALLAEEPSTPGTAVLWPLRDEKPAPVAGIMGALAASETPWKVRLKQRIGDLWSRAVQGDFPPTPGDGCAHCTLAALCGRPVEVDVDETEDPNA